MVWDPRSDSDSDDAMAVSMQEAMACVCLTSTYDEAAACREVLADYGIPAVLGASRHNVPAAGVPVLVPEKLLAQANDVVTHFLAAAVDPDECDDEPFDDDDEDDDDDLDDDLDDDFEDDVEDV